MPSKNGKRTATSRRMSLKPQPVSGVASRSIARRTLLAMREERNLMTPSLRRLRMPATRPRRGGWLPVTCNRRHNFRGIVGIVLPVAVERLNPFTARGAKAGDERRTFPGALLVADDTHIRVPRLYLRQFARRRIGRTVVDEQNLERTAGASAAATSSASGAMLPASLNTGTSTVSARRGLNRPSAHYPWAHRV